MENRAIEGMDVMELAVKLAKEGHSSVMATVVWRHGPSSGQSSSRALITEDGQLHGWIGGACAEPVLIREAKRVLEEAKPKLIWLGQESDFVGMHIPEGVVTIPISCQSDGALQIYIEPMHSAPKLLIVGRSPMALTLAHLAESLDWRVQLVDGNDLTSSMVTPSTAVVIATQGHGDEEVTEIALTQNPAYIGVVASSRRGNVLVDYLSDRGVAEEKLRRLRIPAGIDLGHTSHREIAVAILAELVQLRATGVLSREFGEKRSIALEVNNVVIDPVCGMTVNAEKANRPFTFENVTYYFCAPGCRSSFEENPASYLNQETKC
jgi:xanthine dehydrogenase accessory factor